jgi:hypothetical protein
MHVQGVSTRKVKAITEELWGHSFSASAISQVNKGLDESLEQLAHRLGEPCPYLILDARYERVREGGVIRSQAGLCRHRHQPVRGSLEDPRLREGYLPLSLHAHNQIASGFPHP